jgi:MFS family permease
MIRRDPVPTPAGADGSARLIRTLTLTVFLQWMGATAIVPMLPVYIRRLGGSDALAGVVMAAFFAAGVLFQYPIGRITDRVGRRPVLVAGLAVYGAASLMFLAPIVPSAAIALRALQGTGAGAAAVASLAMISGSVAAERRGRAFASIFGGEIAGMAVGPLVGSLLGVHYMWAIFLGSGIISFAACIPALRIAESGHIAEERVEAAARRAGGSAAPLSRIAFNRSMVGALVAGSALGLANGVYDICWTLLLVSRGASGWEIGLSWTLFAVPFVIAAKPSGWLADHMDRRVLVVAGIGLSATLCASYPFVHSVPALIVLAAFEALGFAAALPAGQSMLTQGSEPAQVGRVQGLFATCQTASTAVAAAAAGAAFALATWLPFVTAASIVVLSLAVIVAIWRSVPGKVQPAGQAGAAAGAITSRPSLVQSPIPEPVGVSWDVL